MSTDDRELVEKPVMAEKQYQAPRKETPAVLHSFPSLIRGNQVLKMRLLQYSRSVPILDIREYVTSDLFSGFTKKGLSLSEEQVQQLHEVLPAILKAFKEK